MRAVEFTLQRKDQLHQAEANGARGVDHVPIAAAGSHHLQAREQQECAEHASHPLEAMHHGHAGADEHRPHDDGTQNAPEQHAVLQRGGHREVAQHHHEHEEVVHAQGHLDHVAGQPLHRQIDGGVRGGEGHEGLARHFVGRQQAGVQQLLRMRAQPAIDEHEQPRVEQQRQHHPERHAPGRGKPSDRLGIAVKQREIRHQQADHHGHEAAKQRQMVGDRQQDRPGRTLH